MSNYTPKHGQNGCLSLIAGIAATLAVAVCGTLLLADGMNRLHWILFLAAVPGALLVAVVAAWAETRRSRQ